METNVTESRGRQRCRVTDLFPNISLILLVFWLFVRDKTKYGDMGLP
jgi:hypothetical protein